MCRPKFCSTKNTQDVRDYAAKQNTDAMLEAGMAAKSAEFRAKGGEIYLPAAEYKERLRQAGAKPLHTLSFGLAFRPVTSCSTRGCASVCCCSPSVWTWYN
jgi:hypothetical protein